MKRLQNIRIHFMRSGRWCTYGMRKWTSILPLDGSHVLTSTCHFGSTTTLVQGLCLCLRRFGHLGMSITLYVAGCQVFCLVYNELKGNTDQSIWTSRHITKMMVITVYYCWGQKFQFVDQGGNWWWIQDFVFCGKSLNWKRLGVLRRRW